MPNVSFRNTNWVKKIASTKNYDEWKALSFRNIYIYIEKLWAHTTRVLSD